MNTAQPGWEKRLGQSWLRDRAKGLRTAASACDGAKYTGKLGDVTRHVGEQYRLAAELLEKAADAMEHAS